VTENRAGASAGIGHQVVELDRVEAMRLLASVDYGRVVFTRGALPAIRLVNHLVDGGRVIVRTRLTATVSTAVHSSTDSRLVVAYETDDLDSKRRAGWSVVLTGWATPLSNPEQISHYEQLLQPWVNMTMDTVIAIAPEIITGIRIIDDNPLTP
jgi:Pyridoxamine 5'-phosphate oxidase